MAVAKGRVSINYHIKEAAKAQLDAIAEHHQAAGRDYMSRTRILETLLERETRRLKLEVPA